MWTLRSPLKRGSTYQRPSALWIEAWKPSAVRSIRPEAVGSSMPVAAYVRMLGKRRWAAGARTESSTTLKRCSVPSGAGS